MEVSTKKDPDPTFFDKFPRKCIGKFRGNVSESFRGNVSESFRGNVSESFRRNVSASFRRNVSESFRGNVSKRFGFETLICSLVCKPDDPDLYLILRADPGSFAQLDLSPGQVVKLDQLQYPGRGRTHPWIPIQNYRSVHSPAYIYSPLA